MLVSYDTLDSFFLFLFFLFCNIKAIFSTIQYTHTDPRKISAVKYRPRAPSERKKREFGGSGSLNQELRTNLQQKH